MKRVFVLYAVLFLSSLGFAQGIGVSSRPVVNGAEESAARTAFRPVAKLIEASTLKFLADGTEPEIKNWLIEFGPTAGAKDLIVPAAALNGLGYHKLAARTLERLIAVNSIAAKDAIANATLADVYNILGKNETALATADRAAAFAISPAEKMHVEFARSIALRDLNRMAEAQGALDRVAKFAKQTDDDGMKFIVSDLRAEGHSMDFGVAGRMTAPANMEPRPPAPFPPISVGLAALLFAGSVGLFFTTRRKLA
jgi:tetratricopeptide (TPR) repeat protein